jgi:hypothetical protein
VEWVKAAFNYAEAYPEEIGLAIQDTQSITEANIRQLLPNLEVIVAPPGEA